VTEENRCTVTVPFDAARISPGNYLVETRKNFSLYNPKLGILKLPNTWNWMDKDKFTISPFVSPDKNQVAFHKAYEYLGNSEDDLMVYGKNIELIGQKTFKNYNPLPRWLDNEHIIYYNDLAPNGPPAYEFYIWDPFTDQLTKQSISINYFSSWNEDIYFGWGVIFDPSLRYATYLKAKDGVPRVTNLKTDSNVWAYNINRFRIPPVWSPDGEKLALIMLDNDRMLLDILTLDGKVQRWVNIEKKPDPNSKNESSEFAVWSPNNHTLAFLGNDNELLLLNMQERVLTHTCIKRDGGFVWSPDSQQIVFAQSEGQVYHNYILDISSMNLMLEPEPLGKSYPPAEWIVNGE
jgi:Tol biopolymer transport system component